MNTQELASKYAIPGILEFSENAQGLVKLNITTAACTAELYLQGAHLTKWRPAGKNDAFFLSERSQFVPGKAIRGGIPIIFPWFGARTVTPLSDRTDGPAHGFARTSNWQLSSATVHGAELQLILTMEADELSRSYGFADFRLTYKLTIGSELELQLAVENNANSELFFEEALHSYFMVKDVHKVAIAGLCNTEYLDKTDGFKRKRQTETLLSLSGETDRPYLNTEAKVEFEDPVLNRQIIVDKQNSQTTVIWNPWSQLTAKMADMDPDGWLCMLCVETANASENAVRLKPGDRHTMQTRIVMHDL